MTRGIFTHTSHPEQVLDLLNSHLPYTLPLLRRIQFMNFPGGSTSTSNILATFSTSIPTRDEAFTLAYLDLSRGPETEMWIYSSVEHPSYCQNSIECEEQVLDMMRYVGVEIQKWEKRIGAEGEKRDTPGIVLCGTMHEKILRSLESKGAVTEKSPSHFKFVFRKQDLPAQKALPEGFEWGVVREEELGLVLSRTGVPRKVRTMKLFPSAAVRVSGSGEIIAWGFLGADGSLTTLHCEEGFRGKGFAKAVSLKLFYEKHEMYAADGLGHADVTTDNMASQGVCKSVGGRAEWHIYWVWVDLTVLQETAERS